VDAIDLEEGRAEGSPSDVACWLKPRDGILGILPKDHFPLFIESTESILSLVRGRFGILSLSLWGDDDDDDDCTWICMLPDRTVSHSSTLGSKSWPEVEEERRWNLPTLRAGGGRWMQRMIRRLPR
jgi:hypothetical protein